MINDPDWMFSKAPADLINGRGFFFLVCNRLLDWVMHAAMNPLRPSPLQNRVTPFGDLVAHPARGAIMGNRGGRIHEPGTKRLTSRRWASRRWIACVLNFKDRQRDVWGESYTELFFLDEATALAAGHRPCFECRRADANRFAAAWARAFNLDRPPNANDMDAALHAERLDKASRPIADPLALPNGAMVANGANAYLVWEHELFEWTPTGYRAYRGPSLRQFRLLTPPTIVAALRAGYAPMAARQSKTSLTHGP